MQREIQYRLIKDAGKGPVAGWFTRELAFSVRGSLKQIEEGCRLMPEFSGDGLIPCVAQDAVSGEVLMLGYMNREALSLTITSGYAHYWSRSRKRLWHKDERSGRTQQVESIYIDDDQDCVLLKVRLTGAAVWHVCYRSCFFRRLVTTGMRARFKLEFVEQAKVYGPVQAYGGKHE